MLRSFISRRQRGDIDEREVRQQTPMGSRSGLGSAVDKRTRFRAASGTARLYIRSRALFAMSRHRQEWGDSTRNGDIVPNIAASISRRRPATTAT